MPWYLSSLFISYINNILMLDPFYPSFTLSGSFNLNRREKKRKLKKKKGKGILEFF